jgi:lipoyl synthase
MSSPDRDAKFRPPLPPWIRVKVSCGGEHKQVSGILSSLRLNTVCQGALCPNQGECWGRGTATFMILGARCTRNCKFCAVGHVESPEAPDPEEPERLAEAALRMKLSYVVVTSVTRDDLPDGGASHFAKTITAVRKALPEAGIEVLTPDFKGVEKDIATVLEAGPSVFNHNVETVERMTPLIRSGGADYRRSLGVLRAASTISKGAIPVKSGIMVGLGERDDEVVAAIGDIRAAGASFLTVGQYLPPSSKHWALDRYVEPAKFQEWGKLAGELGFTSVASGPLVRSSYNAAGLAEDAAGKHRCKDRDAC